MHNLKQGCLAKLNTSAFFREIRQDVYEQVWFDIGTGKKGVSKLTPFEAYAEGVEVGHKVPKDTLIFIVDWSNRVDNQEAWREDAHLVIQTIVGENILYLDVHNDDPKAYLTILT